MAYFAELESGTGEWVFSIEDVKTALVDFNPDVTVDSLSALYSAVSADEIHARHGN